jgi:hypothetical protein
MNDKTNQSTKTATQSVNSDATIVNAPSSPLTTEQRKALFDAAAQGMTPDRVRKKPADPILPWIPQILRKHKQGFSPKQIAAIAGAPGIGLTLSARAVRRLIAQHSKPAAARPRATVP